MTLVQPVMQGCCWESGCVGPESAICCGNSLIRLDKRTDPSRANTRTEFGTPVSFSSILEGPVTKNRVIIM